MIRSWLPLCIALSACGGEPSARIQGRVVRWDGTPVAGATVDLPGGGAARTGADGTFSLTADRTDGAVVASVTIAGERTHAAPAAIVGGETTLVVPNAPAPGTADLWLGGDVMFSRRFADRNADGDLEDAIVHPDDPEPGASAALAFAAPLMKDADVAIVNLETTVTDSGMIHPRKPYTLRSAPGILPALAAAGVTVVGLANNHIYDYLDEGIARMIELVDETGLARVGAGRNWDEAVTPKIVEANGLKIALIAATSITGRPYRDGEGDAWEGDDLPPYYTADPPEQTGGQPKGGALRLDEANLIEAIARADAVGADAKVLLVHGGTQYAEEESNYVRRMARFAIDRGVHLVVGHHPHVIQGIEVYRGVPILYSLGNLVFDQQFIETFPALVVEARARRGGFEHVAVRAVWLDEYAPRALVGEDAVRLLRRVAARSAGMGATLRIDPASGRAVIIGVDPPAGIRDVEVEASFPAGARRSVPAAIPAIQAAEFVRAVATDSALRVDLARSLHIDASFVDGCADDGDHPAGWSLVGSEKRIVDGVLSLKRTSVSAEDSTARTSGRIPLPAGKRLTLVGRWQRDVSAGTAVARLALYADRETHATPVAVAEARAVGGADWQTFVVDLVPTPSARYAQIQLVHEPPTVGDAGEVRFDDVELLAWEGAAPAGTYAVADATYLAVERDGGAGPARARVTLTGAPEVTAP